MEQFNYCLSQFDIGKFLKYSASYVGLLLLADKYKFRKPVQFAGYVISMVATYEYLLAENNKQFVSYYIYDTVQSMANGDWIYILHHIGSLHVALVPPTDVTYDQMRRGIYMIKSADLLFYLPKIMSSIDAECGKCKVSLYSRYATILLWLWFRVVKPFSLYPFKSTSIDIVCKGLHVANAVWLWSMIKSAMKNK